MENNIPADLIVRYLCNEATPEEAEKLHDWVSESHHNQRIFTEWMDAWQHKAPRLNDDYAVNDALKKLNERIDALDEKPRVRSIHVFAIAASVALLVAAAVGLYFALPGFSTTPAITMSEVRTTASVVDTVLLSDGSTIILNENTLLRYPEQFDAARREVILEGEAFFDVKRDTLRPFVIRTGNLSTQVLGTSFNIQTLPAAITVTVVTGKVSVSDEQQHIVLLPHDKATYSTQTKHLLKSNTDLLAELAWRNPVLTFRDATLAEVAVSLEKHYNVSVKFEHDGIRKCLLTGTFKNQPLKTVLSAIAFSTGLTYKQTNSQLTFYGKGCNQ